MEIEKIYQIYRENSIILTDTRKIQPKGIFFALKGNNFNGNKFAQEAINKGASFAIVDEEIFPKNKKIILVDNTLKTLQELATHHRRKLSIPFIGITGSNGKTTSKELINNVLNSKFKSYATEGNLNNHIGVPLSILKVHEKKHEIAIIEMGANHEKEIDFLCQMAMPTHGIITNIGSAHLEGFKNLQGVINAKSELYQYIQKNNGTIFVNAQDKLLMELSKNIKKITYGNHGDCKGNILKNTPFINIKFNTVEIASNLIGEYQFNNIMLAICVGQRFGVLDIDIKNSIQKYKPKNNRSEIIKTDKNILILDAYNANPSSMKEMITSFAKQEYSNKLCILGDMLELGKYTEEKHIDIIKLVEKLKLEVILIGEEFYNVSKKSFRNREDFETFLKSQPIKKKTILLKGSRGLQLEKLTKYL